MSKLVETEVFQARCKYQQGEAIELTPPLQQGSYVVQGVSILLPHPVHFISH